MEEAIKRAIRGGYSRSNMEDYLVKLPDYAKNQIWIDPNFWECLGKHEGWEEKTYYEINCQARNYQTYEETSEITWKLQMHRLIDHLIEGKDAESFFGELLAKE